MKTFLLRHRLFFWFISILLVILVGGTIFSLLNPQETQLTPIPTENRTTTVQNSISISPAISTTLSPNSKPQFILVFPTAIKGSDIKIKGTVNDIPPTGDASPMSFSQEFVGNNQAILTPLQPIAPSSVYTITILNSQNTTVFSVQYVSADISPTPVPKNNLSLILYLPYETKTFKLSYDKPQNIYVFSFNFDENSSDTLDVQFEKAKQEAITYIQNKGVDIDSIVINWNYH